MEDIKVFDLKSILTDELTDIREKARAYKNFKLSDEIRIELDSRGSFCIDTKQGQEVYHMGDGWTRKRLIAEIKDVNAKFKRNKTI